jgi:hypothetical protein
MSFKKQNMKKNIRVAAFATILIIASIIILAQNRGDQQAITADQINQSIQNFAKLVTPQTAESFGLKNADQLKQLSAGKQFKKFMIGLDDIKNYQSTTDVNSLVKELEVVEVAIVDQAGQIQTAIEFTRNDGKWEASAFGLSADLKRVKDAQAFIPDSVLKSSRLISIPALRTTFLAAGEGASTKFYVLENNDRLELKRGSVITPADAIQKLKISANEYNGLPD